jgi:glycine/D-amino acid oxidase-like deaminating enzyme
MASFDVLILGAGIVGCACAREFAQAGLRVGIAEPGAIAGEATSAAMGHIVVLDDSPAQLTLTAYARSLWTELSPQLPANVEAGFPGTLWIAGDHRELEALQTKQAIYAKAGVMAELLTAAMLAEQEPYLRPGLAGALLVPHDGVLAPAAGARFFFDQAMQAGAVLLRGRAAIRASQGTVQLDDGSTHTAAHIVIATGAHMRLAPSVPMQQRKGQLLLTVPSPGLLRHQIVELGYLRSAHQLTGESIAFNIQPRRSGEILIGSSRQSGTLDPAIDQPLLQRMLERAYSFMPALAGLATARTWTGFRAATPDKIPYLGPTEDPSVLLAMGFEGLGITTAPAAARLLLDHILGRPSAIDPAPYLPVRIATTQETP